MFVLTPFFVFLFFHLKLVASDSLDQDQYCVSSVYGAYDSILFEGIGYDDYWVGSCQNQLKVTSIYAASLTYCSLDEFNAGVPMLAGYCTEYGEVELLPMIAVAANLTPEGIKSMKVVTQDDLASGDNMTEPVIISRDYFDLSYNTVCQLWFLGTILVVGMLGRIIQLVRDRQASHFSVDTENRGPGRRHTLTSPLSKAYSYVQKHFVIPGVLSSRHRVPLMWCTIPTRMEAFVVYSFWIISIVLGCVNYRAFTGNLYWSEISPQLWRYIADRTGIMAYSNLCLIWMLGGRNNIFIWLTGWQFSTFNLFHRHIARVATLQAIMHSIAYTAYYFVAGHGDYYYEEFKETCMSLIVFFSFMWFRTKSYEVFLLIHIVLSVAVIVALFYHTSIFEGEYDPYLWPLVAIWSFDRFLRIVRVVVCNLNIFSQKGRQVHPGRSVVAYDADTDILRVEVAVAAVLFKPQPGQHYYLYQPFRLKGWENHPFTLAYWERPNSVSSDPLRLDATVAVTRDPDVSLTASSSSSADGTLSQEKPQSGQVVQGKDTRMVFWVRPVDGWTRSLRNMCTKSANGIATTTILIEGPYGHAEPLWKFDRVMMIAGGSGIAAIVRYMLDHDARAARMLQATPDSETRGTRTRAIDLIWVNKTSNFMQQVVSRELAGPIARNNVTLRLYATQNSGLEAGAKGKEPEPISFDAGRPNIAALVAAAAAEAQISGDRLAILVCGPGGLADATRAATHKALKNCTVSIEYFEEAFGW
ncbi:hypothetical protein GQ53DRAFT_712143 [Thozetella sp. PMI_491]|nr:hypothetical protein GQ53DRAFT_712143 [Thozetella sp. PMI_491]